MVAYSLDIVIVNWNSGDQLRDCLESIRQFPGSHLALVTVVDNASHDDSLRGINEFGLPLRVIYNEENRGFAAACNQGARESSGEYLLFLNPDTRVFEGSLDAPIAFMARSENVNVGIAGVQLLDEFGCISYTCARFPSLGRFVTQALGIEKIPGLSALGSRMSSWNHAQTRAVDQVIGAFFLVRRALYNSLSGFDERFFVYFEEVDFCCRARKAGWKSVYFAESCAFHAGGGTSRNVKAQRLFYSLRSRLQYAFKHFPRWQAITLFVITTTAEPITRIIWCGFRLDFPGVLQTCKAYNLLLRYTVKSLGAKRALIF